MAHKAKLSVFYLLQTLFSLSPCISGGFTQLIPNALMSLVQPVKWLTAQL